LPAQDVAWSHNLGQTIGDHLLAHN
jgi:hypothetical protein